MFPTSSTWDGKRQCCELRFMNYQTEVVSFRDQLLLNISAARQWSWQYLTSMDQRSWWRGNEQMRGQIGSPKPTEASERPNQISPPWRESRGVPCSRATYCRHDLWLWFQNFLFPPPFLASTPIIFNKLDGDSICLRYKFDLRSNPT